MTAIRTLIAEDDFMIAMFLEELLVAMGHEVCAVVADQAATVAAVAEILQTRYVPHIFATGDCFRVLAHNPDAIVLQKPYTAKALTRAIEQALQTPAERA